MGSVQGGSPDVLESLSAERNKGLGLRAQGSEISTGVMEIKKRRLTRKNEQ
jgi:hypothetical protein